jgi:hypothetical protein
MIRLRATPKANGWSPERYAQRAPRATQTNIHIDRIGHTPFHVLHRIAQAAVSVKVGW